MNAITFECQLYISGRDRLTYHLPASTKPRKIARFKSPSYDELVDPAFRKLLATFEAIPAT
ncbi:MAG TPA: hypothetical protein VI322_00555 [Candidatus Saccharimonadia bacterium]